MAVGVPGASCPTVTAAAAVAAAASAQLHETQSAAMRSQTRLRFKQPSL